MLTEPILFERINGVEYFISSNGERFLAKEILHTSRNKVYKDNPAAIYHLYENSGFKNTSDSILIFNDTFESPQMSSLIYPSKIVKKLNSQGLKIILAENILKYDGPRIKIDRSNVRKKIKMLRDKNGFDGNFLEPPRAFQLDSIQDLVTNNKLTNVTVYAPEQGLERFSNRYTFNYVYKDIYLSSFIKEISHSIGNYEKDIKTRFLNYNWRYEPFRHMVAAFLSNYDSAISWYYSSSKEIFEKNSWFEIRDHKLLSGLEKLNSKVPLNLDAEVRIPVKLRGGLIDRVTLPTKTFYPKFVSPSIFKNTFCTVVNESGFIDSTSYISDKTLMSIWNMSPFILVAPPNSLALLKQLGFKTFSKYWDESYDTKLDHKKRLFKIFETIDQISKLSDDEVISMYQDMQNILIYNKKILENWKHE